MPMQTLHSLFMKCKSALICLLSKNQSLSIAHKFLCDSAMFYFPEPTLHSNRSSRESYPFTQAPLTSREATPPHIPSQALHPSLINPRGASCLS